MGRGYRAWAYRKRQRRREEMEEVEVEERKSCESFHEHKLADRRNDG